MNRIYRVIWSRVTQRWVVVSETTRAVQTGSSRRRSALKLLALSLLLGVMANAQAAPIGGQVTAGQGDISQTGNTTTIRQSSQNLSLNWQSFNIAPQETVKFEQPNAQAIAVNRVVGSHQATQIQGHLNANGQVWLIDPNGIQFNQGSTVNVGGLVASTLNITDEQLQQSQRQFSGSSTASVINQGTIQTNQGGYVALIANQVSNQGSINTPQGTTALAAGSAVTVTFAENSLVGIQVDQSTLNNLAENKQLIQAQGGTVIMSAGARDSMLGSTVNNDGVIEAHTLGELKGNITLLSGMKSGTTTVDGTLDASAPQHGDGGAIDTSGAHVNIAPAAQITTKAAQGKSGTWTIDPQDYTIAASGGDITGAQISNLLGSNNIVISSVQGATSGLGDLNVNNAITWSNTNTLTLQAVRNINFNAGGVVTNTAGGTLSAYADMNATGVGTIVMNGGTINMVGSTVNLYDNPANFGTPRTFVNVNTNKLTVYMLINSVAKLQSMYLNTSSSASYALSKSLDMAGQSYTAPSNFQGSFDGRNYSISNLTVGSPTQSNNNQGMFGNISNPNARVVNLTLVNITVYGLSNVGALAGSNSATLSNITLVSGSVIAAGSKVGGVVGEENTGSVSNISSNLLVSDTAANNSLIGGAFGRMGGGTVTNVAIGGQVIAGLGDTYVGGFAGEVYGTIQYSSVTGTVGELSDGNAGGFVGQLDAGSLIFASYTTANISAGAPYKDNVGGFAGVNYGTIASSYETGNVAAFGQINDGGFVGLNTGTISNSVAYGSITITRSADGNLGVNYGGFAGLSNGGAFINDTANGNITVSGNNAQVAIMGGLIGGAYGTSVTRSNVTGNLTAINVGDQGGIGGLFGEFANGSTASNVYSTGNVTVIQGGSNSTPVEIGGIVGWGNSPLTNVYYGGVLTLQNNVGTTNFNFGGVTGASLTVNGRSFFNSTNTSPASAGPSNNGRLSSGDYSANVVGLNAAQMTVQANFTSATAANGNVNPNWDFNNIWTMGTTGPVFKTPNGPTVTPGPTAITAAAPGAPSVTSYYPLAATGLVANTKTYDGTTSATINGTLNGLLPGNSVTVSILGNFVDKNAGANKQATVTSAVLSGSDAGSYVLVPASSLSAQGTIQQRALVLAITAANKIYDGNTSVTLSGTVVSGTISGDVVTVAASGNFVSANAQTNQTVNVTTAAVGNSNYTVGSFNTTTTATIQQKALTLNVTGVNKAYDGSLVATLNAAIIGAVGGDQVTASATGLFANANVGTNKAITVNSTLLGGNSAGNYNITSFNSTTLGSITPRALTIQGVAYDKVYNADNLGIVALSSSGIVSTDVNTVNITYGSAIFTAGKNVGNGKAVSVTGIQLNGLGAGNYSVANPTLNLSANITPKQITAQAQGVNKIYDGTTAGQAVVSSTGTYTGDAVNFTGIATFASADAGTNLPVNVTNIQMGGADASNYTLLGNTADTTANITPKGITLIATATNKVYDGNRNAVITIIGSGVLARDPLSFSGTGTFATKDVVGTQTVTLSGITASGTGMGNYSFNTTATTSASITAAAITANIIAENKIYNAKTDATAFAISTEILAGDDVSISIGAANFSDKNVGAAKTVTATGLALNGANKANYSLISTSATGSADISAREITVQAQGINKIYDGTDVGQATTTSTGVYTGDDVTFSGIATFASADAGNNILVNVTNIQASGADVHNYIQTNTTAETYANIIPKGITLIATATNKVYDGTREAAMTIIGSGVLARDPLSFSGTGTFATKDVVGVQTVNVSNITARGTGVSNYSFNTTATTSASITAKSISATITAENKIYNARTDATAFAASSEILAGDDVSIDIGAANFSDKNVGIGKTVTGTGLTLTGANAADYALTSTSASGTANISAREIVAQAQGINKIYDGTFVGQATVSSADVFAGDAVSFTGTGTFASKNVGDNIPMSVTGIRMSGADIGNYFLTNSTANAVASIIPRGITVAATAADKTYDDTTEVSVAYSSPDTIQGDDVSILSSYANFASKNVGTQSVLVQGMILEGGDAGNYTLNNTTASTSATITRLDVTVAVMASNKIYDGGTAAQVALSINKLFSNNSVTASYSAANFSDKNAATGKTVTISGLSLSGNDAGNYRLATTTATALANIDQLTITPVATGGSKAYDGTTTAQATVTSRGFLAGDSAAITYASAVYNSKDASTSKIVIVDGMALTGTDAGNYVLSRTTTDTTGVITPITIQVRARGNDKIYDSNSGGTATYYGDGVLAVDATSITFTGTVRFADSNVGTNKTVTVTDISDLGAAKDDYIIDNTTATTTANITPATLTFTAYGNSKIYDGGTDATVNLKPNVFAGDDVVLGYARATFASKDVATSIPISVTGVTITGGASANNYVLDTTTATTSARISPLGTVVSAVNATVQAQNKVYDGNDSANVTLSLNGILSADIGNVGVADLSATFSDKNVGAGKLVTVKGLFLTGEAAINYNLATTDLTTTADITARTATVNATAINKIYDGSNAANVYWSINNVVPGDALTATGTATFDSANAGTGKLVNVSNITLSDNSNYVLGNTTAVARANILQKSVAVVAEGVDKVYDGSTVANVTLTTVGNLPGDALSAGYGSANFADASAAEHKAISVTDIYLVGDVNNNYSPINTSAHTQATINQRVLALALSGGDKIYDGSDATTTTITPTNLVGNDKLTVGATSASFDTKDVGSGKAVTAFGLYAQGDALNNYVLPGLTITGTASVTPKTITPTILAESKSYDSTTNADFIGSSSGLISGDRVIFTGTAAFSDKNAGTGKTVIASNLALTGQDAANYRLATTIGTASANITPREILAEATGIDKTYDGGTNGSALVSPVGAFTGDTLGVTYRTANFVDANAGAGKLLTVGGLGLTGADASNYALAVTTIQTTATINQRVVTAIATGGDKVFDNEAGAQVRLGASNLVAGDSLALGYGESLFTSAQAEVNKTITTSGIYLQPGAATDNYTLADSTVTNQATIMAKGIRVTITAADRAYNGTTAADVSYDSSDIYSGNVVNITGRATFSDKNVGNGKAVTADNLSLGGADATNYFVVNTANKATTTANITPAKIEAVASGVTKTYDGGTSVSALVNLVGTFTGDAVAATYDTASFVDASAGSDKLFNVGRVRLIGADSGNYAVIDTSIAGIGTITPRVLTVTATGGDKVYDNNAGANVILSLHNGVPGDPLAVGYTESLFDNARVGVNKTVITTGFYLQPNPVNSNYTLASSRATNQATISAKGINVLMTAANKDYDGSTAANATYSSSDIYSGNVVNITGTATFSDKNVGSDKTVTANNLSLSGADAANYFVANTADMASTTASISPKLITVLLQGVNKTYDANTNASVLASPVGVVSGDSVGVSYSTASFNDANAASDKLISIRRLVLTGFDAANYLLEGDTSVATGAILPRQLTLHLVAENKVYDQSNRASVILSATGFLNGGQAGISFQDATFASKNAGLQTVTVSGITLEGNSNYTVAPIATVQGLITSKPIQVTITGINKFADFSTHGTVNVSSSDIYSGDNVGFQANGVHFAQTTVGSNIPVSLAGVTMYGRDALNYTITTDLNGLMISANILARPEQPVGVIVSMENIIGLIPDYAATEFVIADYDGIDSITGGDRDIGYNNGDYYTGKGPAKVDYTDGGDYMDGEAVNGDHATGDYYTGRRPANGDNADGDYSMGTAEGMNRVDSTNGNVITPDHAKMRREDTHHAAKKRHNRHPTNSREAKLNLNLDSINHGVRYPMILPDHITQKKIR